MRRHGGSHQVIVTLVLVAVLCAPPGIWAQTPNQVFQTRPIQLGTSGGNINDLSRLFCCSGTLGSLVQNATTQFILSNNHVLARTNKAQLGEGIIQPGLIDQTPVCAQNTADIVANLSAFNTISFTAGATNTIDAAIAQVIPGDVNTGGSILEIGQVSSSIVAPTLGLAVKKSGRTSGLTTGSIAAINVTANVQYFKQCGIGSQTAQFVNQIAITPGTFSAGGDSGSLIVENVATCPRLVGLLFAGSDTITLANPISDVLAAFGVSMVGCSSSPPPPSPGLVTSLSAVPSSAVVSQTVTFTVSGTGTCGGLTLTFGDGTSTSLSGAFPLTASHAYGTTGTFTATATGTVSCTGSASTSVSVTTSSPPPPPSVEPDSGSAAQGPPVDPAAIAEATRVKGQHEQALLSHPGVVGVGVGLSHVVPGQVTIDIFVERDTAEVRQALPSQLDSIPVQIVETGKIKAFGGSCSQAP